MSCHKCGAALSGDAKFCPNCGAKAAVPVGDTMAGDIGAETKADTAKRYAKLAADEVVVAGRSALKTKLGKEMATGAAVGAVLALPIPFIGPLAGAAIGTGFVIYKRYLKG